MRKIKLKKNRGILFWVTGLSGSGKTRIAKKIVNDITKSYGKTIVLSGDDIRNIFKLKGYSYEERLNTVFKYCKLAIDLSKIFKEDDRRFIHSVSYILELFLRTTDFKFPDPYLSKRPMRCSIRLGSNGKS